MHLISFMRMTALHVAWRKVAPITRLLKSYKSKAMGGADSNVGRRVGGGGLLLEVGGALGLTDFPHRCGLTNLLHTCGRSRARRGLKLQLSMGAAGCVCVTKRERE